MDNNEILRQRKLMLINQSLEINGILSKQYKNKEEVNSSTSTNKTFLSSLPQVQNMKNPHMQKTITFIDKLIPRTTLYFLKRFAGMLLTIGFSLILIYVSTLLWFPLIPVASWRFIALVVEVILSIVLVIKA